MKIERIDNQDNHNESRGLVEIRHSSYIISKGIKEFMIETSLRSSSLLIFDLFWSFERIL
jgi:hypothetical protein